MRKRRFAVVGTGTRATYMWIEPMVKADEYAGKIEPVGLFDINPDRAHACNRMLGSNIPVYGSFKEMLRKSGAEALIVTTIDSTHAKYVVGALNAGIDVYSEKPLCTELAHVKSIREAVANSKNQALVTHNARFLPCAEKVKREIMNGRIGKPCHINFRELLDRYHGADYFRRWHREFKNSGGLLLQKSSHHFDLINWWLESRPKTVSAIGGLLFYGRNGTMRGTRCSKCKYAKKCELYADIFANAGMKKLFKEVEDRDGYIRDRCVFGKEIDITDTANLSISYENGAQVSYSLAAYCSYEAQQVSIEGTNGRIEWNTKYTTQWVAGQKKKGKSKGSLVQAGGASDQVYFMSPYSREMEEITPAAEQGSHGGADPRMKAAVFERIQPKDPLRQRAALEEGIQAVLLGIAANRSIELGGKPIDVQTGKPVR